LKEIFCLNWILIMEKPTDSYGHMLEKYRELDEDEILSNLTDEQLHQLEVN